MPRSVPATGGDNVRVLRAAMARLGSALGRLAEGELPERDGDPELASAVLDRLGLG